MFLGLRWCCRPTRVVEQRCCYSEVFGCLCHSEVVRCAWYAVHNWLAWEDVYDSVTETAIAWFLFPSLVTLLCFPIWVTVRVCVCVCIGWYVLFA